MIKNTSKKVFLQANEFYVVLLFFVAAVFIRLYCTTVFFGQSADEMCNVHLINETFKHDFNYSTGTFMFFYYFIGAVLMFFVHNAYVAALTVSVFLSSLSIVLVYYIARELFDRPRAALATSLLLINPEFTLIGSTTLREPTAACFMLLACWLLMRRHILWAAVAGVIAFLTRFEYVFTLMPGMLFAVTLWEKRWWKRLFWMGVVAALLAAALWFLHSINCDVFERAVEVFYDQKTVMAHGGFLDRDPSWRMFVANSFLGDLMEMNVFMIVTSLIKKLGHACLNMLHYVYMLIGPNILFFLLGLGLYGKRALRNERGKIFLTLFALQCLFFFGYLFEFETLIFWTYRYLYWLLPFAAIFISHGFFYCWQWRKGRVFLALLLACNIVIGGVQYAGGVGAEYFAVSIINKRLIKIGDWAQRNIPPGPDNKILSDGVAYFYLGQKNSGHVLLSYAVPCYKDWNDPEEFMKYLSKKQAHFVLWDNNSLWCRTGTPYLQAGTTITTDIGELIPLKKWEDVFLYEFIANGHAQ